MPLIARQRSRLAVLAVLALVGSLLAVSAVPVAADDGKADNEAKYSACVGAAAEDAEFTDMDGSFAEDAANCLAHYGITKGTSEGVFSPNASVTRLQMALFLSRAAGPAGIVLPAASDQGFGDISGMSDEIQDAINQIAELDIMAGRSDNEFDPVGMVTRVDMAVHLAAFLSEAVVGPGGQDIDDKKFESDDTGFEDLGSVTFAAYGAINDLFELGVTTGTTDTMYSPAALVSRGQMAAFITRALAHTNARPAGLSVQASATDVFVDDPVTFVASVRDRNNQPVADSSVDFFYLDDEDEEPFNDDGECTNVIVSLTGTDECEINASDLTTGLNGNLDEASLDVDADTTVWAWTGDLGDDFDADDTESVTIEISAAAAAAKTRLTDSADTDTVHFGDEVTFTFQLVDSDGDPVSRDGETVTVRSLIEVSGDAESRERGRTDTHETDASGRIEVSFTEDDPDDDDSNDMAVLTLTITNVSEGPLIDDDDDPINDSDDKIAGIQIMVTWDDDEAVATNLELSASRDYSEASMAGKGVGNTVRATLTDQYGDPISKAKVRFESADPERKGGRGAPDTTKSTNGRGVASLGYQRDSANAGTETFNACHTIKVVGIEDAACDKQSDDTYTDPDSDDPLKVRKDDFDAKVEAVPLKHYWAKEASKADSGKTIVVVDTANNTIVVDTKEPTIVKYDSRDYFYVDDTPKVLADFEDELDVGDKLEWTFTYVKDDEGKLIKDDDGKEVIDEQVPTVFTVTNVP